MKVFNLTNKLNRVKKIEFKLEKDMQILVESNLDELLGLTFVASEYSIRDYRFDTVSFNKETNAFIIIEYKRNKNGSLVDQGYAYLSTMLEYKANLVLLYNERFNESKQVKDFSWSDSRVYFISATFTKYQTNATSFADMPFNLFEIKKYENGIVIFEEVSKNDKISTKELSTTLNSNIGEVNKEVIVYTEQIHLNNKADKVVELYNEFKIRIFELGDVTEEIKKKYITFKTQVPLCQVVVMSKMLKVYINSKYQDTQVLKESNYKIRDVTNIGHWGSFHHEYVVEDIDDLEDLLFYIRRIVINHRVIWIVNTFSDNIFKGVSSKLHWCQIPKRRVNAVIIKPIYIICQFNL